MGWALKLCGRYVVLSFKCKQQPYCGSDDGNENADSCFAYLRIVWICPDNHEATDSEKSRDNKVRRQHSDVVSNRGAQ